MSKQKQGGKYTEDSDSFVRAPEGPAQSNKVGGSNLGTETKQDTESGKLEFTRTPLNKLIVEKDNISYKHECSYAKGKFYTDQVAG